MVLQVDQVLIVEQDKLFIGKIEDAFGVDAGHLEIALELARGGVPHEDSIESDAADLAAGGAEGHHGVVKRVRRVLHRDDSAFRDVENSQFAAAAKRDPFAVGAQGRHRATEPHVAQRLDRGDVPKNDVACAIRGRQRVGVSELGPPHVAHAGFLLVIRSPHEQPNDLLALERPEFESIVGAPIEFISPHQDALPIVVERKRQHFPLRHGRTDNAPASKIAQNHPRRHRIVAHVLPDVADHGLSGREVHRQSVEFLEEAAILGQDDRSRPEVACRRLGRREIPFGVGGDFDCLACRPFGLDDASPAFRLRVEAFSRAVRRGRFSADGRREGIVGASLGKVLLVGPTELSQRELDDLAVFVAQSHAAVGDRDEYSAQRVAPRRIGPRPKLASRDCRADEHAETHDEEPNRGGRNPSHHGIVPLLRPLHRTVAGASHRRKAGPTMGVRHAPVDGVIHGGGTEIKFPAHSVGSSPPSINGRRRSFGPVRPATRSTRGACRDETSTTSPARQPDRRLPPWPRASGRAPG